MKTPFSLINAIKVSLAGLALVGSCLVANTASAQYFSTRGTEIVDPSGDPIFFNGTNLANWLVWEGYMMGFGDFRTHSQIWGDINNALGGNWMQAIDFENKWRENYVTQRTIDELSSRGYNSVRVPFNYRLFWKVGSNEFDPNGFKYIDNLISYCRNKGVYILLDMHGTPGYQNTGDHSDNDTGRVEFLDNGNVQKTAEIWKYIAQKYNSEPIIWGYDIVNEPNTDRSDELFTAYQTIIRSIREVDKHHIVVVEGDYWGSYMQMFTNWGRTALDSKVVLQTHHYPNSWKNGIPAAEQAIGDLDGRKAIANQLNVPIILGEFGEDRNEIMSKLRDRAKNGQYSGIFSWPFKKLFIGNTLWTINPDGNSPEGRAYNSLVNAYKSNTTLNQSYVGDLMNFATYAIRNEDSRLVWHDDFYKSTASPVGPVVKPVDPSIPSTSISGTYVIVSKSSGKALEVRGGWLPNGTPIQQWSYVGLPWQKWNIIPLGGNTYKIIDVNSGKALDLRGGNTQDGGAVQIWDDVNVPNQRWIIEFNSGRNAYVIKSTVAKPSGAINAIDVPGGTTLDGNALQIWTFYSSNVNQEWELRKL